MDLLEYKDLAVPLATVIGALIGALTTRASISNNRSRLKDDVEVLSKLEEGSNSHLALKAHIEWQIDQVVWREQRDKFSFVMKVLMLITLVLYMIGYTVDFLILGDPETVSVINRLIAGVVVFGIVALGSSILVELLGRARPRK